MPKLHVFTAGLSTETNSFSPLVATAADYTVQRGGVPDGPATPFESPLQVWRTKTREQAGWNLTESLNAFAMPSGRTVKRVYEDFRDEIIRDLRAAMPVDIVLLNLHGSMEADGIFDCEGDLLSRVRAVVSECGKSCAVGAELDLHCHPTEAMVSSADALVIYKEWPHIDSRERAAELFEIAKGTAEGRVEPVMSLFNTRVLGLFPTTREPMKAFVSEMVRAEALPGVLSVSLAHDHQWTDVPGLGARMLVITDERTADPHTGHSLAKSLGTQFYAIRDEAAQRFPSLKEGLSQAAELPPSQWPVVLVDVPDNPGGGGPGDGTFVLKALIEAGKQRVSEKHGNHLSAALMLWDNNVARVCAGAGVGSRLHVRLGGKAGPVSGDPLDLKIQVTAVHQALTQQFLGGVLQMGDAVALRVLEHGGESCANEIDVVVITERSNTTTPECFEKLGIDVKQKHILVPKTLNNCKPGFDRVATNFIWIDYHGGCCTGDVRAIAFEHLDLPMYPWQHDPLGIDGDEDTASQHKKPRL